MPSRRHPAARARSRARPRDDLAAFCDEKAKKFTLYFYVFFGRTSRTGTLMVSLWQEMVNCGADAQFGSCDSTRSFQRVLCTKGVRNSNIKGQVLTAPFVFQVRSAEDSLTCRLPDRFRPIRSAENSCYCPPGAPPPAELPEPAF